MCEAGETLTSSPERLFFLLFSLEKYIMVSSIDVFLDLPSDLICFIAKGWLELKPVVILMKRSALHGSVYMSPKFAVSAFPQLSEAVLYESFMKCRKVVPWQEY